MERKLPGRKNSAYWALVRARAKQLGSDGCTKSPDIYVECCYEHDIHWRTGQTIFGEPITENEANARFQQCIHDRSKVRRIFGFSPWAAIARLGVTIGGLFHKQPKAEEEEVKT